MKLQELIRQLPSRYDPSFEQSLVDAVKATEAASLTEDLANLLSFSISEGYNKLAIAILEKNYKGKTLDLASINNSIIAQSEENYSLLHFAALFGNKEMLLYFLQNNIPISFDKDQLSPLHILTFSNKLSSQDINIIIKEMKIRFSEIVNLQDVYGLTAMHYAAHKNNMEAIKALLENGAVNRNKN